METQAGLRILYIERLNGDAIIGFNDGKCGIYSAHLLYTVLPQALDISVEDDPPDNVTSITRRPAHGTGGKPLFRLRHP